jgi:hypothetical protein
MMNLSQYPCYKIDSDIVFIYDFEVQAKVKYRWVLCAAMETTILIQAPVPATFFTAGL